MRFIRSAGRSSSRWCNSMSNPQLVPHKQQCLAHQSRHLFRTSGGNFLAGVLIFDIWSPYRIPGVVETANGKGLDRLLRVICAVPAAGV